MSLGSFNIFHVIVYFYRIILEQLTNFTWHNLLQLLPRLPRKGDLEANPFAPTTPAATGPCLLCCPLRRCEEVGTMALRRRPVVRISLVFSWGAVGVVGAASERINLPQLLSYTSEDLHGGASELMATCAARSFRLAAWSSRHSSDLARSVSLCVAGVRGSRRRWRPGRGGSSGARMLIRRWWICRSSPTLSMGGDRSWSKTARGRPPVDVPQRHVPCCVQQICSSTHKALLAMVLFWIFQWWRLDVSSSVRLGDVGVKRRRSLWWLQETLGIVLYFSIF